MENKLKFADLTLANLERLPQFRNRRGELCHTSQDGSDWNLAEWMNAIAGETGEACNMAKKLRRGDFGLPGSLTYQAAQYELAKELADIVIYCDITCRRCGHMLGDVVVEKFNEVSDRIGVGLKLSKENAT